jgi:UDP-glucose 4-epimerase
MTDKRVVLITGIAGYWGSRLASRLSEEPELHVLGLDDAAPPDRNENLDFVMADLRNPALVELLESENVHSVCHLKFIENFERNEAAFDQNMMGTRKLLGACTEAGVRKIIIRSSTAVYGAHPDNSAFLTEDMPLRGSRQYGTNRDLLEIETFVNGFIGQTPQTLVTVLRFANIIGWSVDTPITRYLKLPSPPVLLGFDPMFQLIHEDDVVEAMAHAVLQDRPGVFNVAAEDPLPLVRVLRLARKAPTRIFHPLAYRSTKCFRGNRIKPLKFVPIEWDYLRYPWVADLTLMRDELGFAPVYRAEGALREFASRRQLKEDVRRRDVPANDEQHLRDVIERRQRVKQRESSNKPATKEA